VEFVSTFGVWIFAERVHASAILSVVTFGMTLAGRAPAMQSARDRIRSNSVWQTGVFVLNVLAFLLMGLQAKIIVSRMPRGELSRALGFAFTVLAIVIGVRFAWILTHWAIAKWLLPARLPAPPITLALLASWCGMRGLVRLATALALPAGFAGRDEIVLTAYTVVLGTLVLQGFTLKPLIRALRIAPDRDLDEEMWMAQAAMLDAALAKLGHDSSDGAATVRAEYERSQALAADAGRARGTTDHHRARLSAIAATRRVLAHFRQRGDIGNDAFRRLEEELDLAELAALPPGDVRVRGMKY
jgi:CPA1 family monovalent cation:H+ antiporter